MTFRQSLILLALAAILTIISVENGCSKFASNRFDAESLSRKHQALTTPIFDASNGQPSVWPYLEYVTAQTVANTPSNETPAPTLTPPLVVKGTVQFLCSNNQTSKLNGLNLITAQSIKFEISDDTNGASGCSLSDTTDHAFQKALLNEKTIDLTAIYAMCAAQNQTLANGVAYRVKIIGYLGNYSADINYIGDGDAQGGLMDFDIKKAGDSYSAYRIDKPNQPPMILANLNKQNGDYNKMLKQYKDDPVKYQSIVSNENNGFCDDRNSPLIIQLGNYGGRPQPIELSSPLDGIKFNLLGSAAAPANNPVQISWFLPTSGREYYFLVNPDANGAVGGIDQMFGDNTRGPDGQLAGNGYEALAKYDVNHDGFIDASDPIFYKLRLWKDDNFNGVAESYELYGLNDMKLIYIDLFYDKNYVESDIYGNQTRMRSVVATSDNQLHLIFDLWFRWL